MKKVLIALLMTAMTGAISAVSYSANLTMKVTDGKVPLEDVTIVVRELRTNLMTSDRGIAFIHDIPDGRYTVFAVLPGYERYSNTVEMKGNDREVQVRLVQVTYSLGEITVESKKDKGKVATETTVKQEELGANSQFVINDALKTLQLMPGVSSGGGTFDSRMYIQGGNQNEWLSYMDGILILNPMRLAGMISMFNPFVIDSIDLYTAGYPAEYGQGLSGIVTVDTKNGNNDRLRGFIDISAVMAELLLEGPLCSNLTVLFDMRRTYYEIYLPLILPANELSGIQFPYLWDGILKIDWDITHSDKLTVDLYGSMEGLAFNLNSPIVGLSGRTGDFSYQQINLIGSAKYTHRFDSGDALDFVAGVTPQISMEELSGSPTTILNLNEYQYLYQLKSDYFLNSIKGHKIQAGVQIVYDNPSGNVLLSNYSLNAQGVWTNSSSINQNLSVFQVAYYGVYLMDNWEVFPSIIIEAGGREEYYTLSGESAFNPQAGIKWESTENLDFYLRGGVYHLFPTDLSYISAGEGNPSLQSEKADHLIGGTEYASGDYLFRLEGFYKYYYGLWEEDSLLHYNNNGIRNVYGGDLYLQKKAKRGDWFSGWIAYTYVDGEEEVTARSAENPANPYDMPLSEWFVPDYLRSHTISAVAEMTYYKNPDRASFLDFIDGWKLSFELSAMSGQPYTPVTNFIQVMVNGNTYSYFNSGSYDSLYTPWYVRLDVKLTIPLGWDFLKGLLGPNVSGYFYIQVLNALDLQNVLNYYYTVQNGQLTLIAERDLPLVPLAGIRLEF